MAVTRLPAHDPPPRPEHDRCERRAGDLEPCQGDTDAAMNAETPSSSVATPTTRCTTWVGEVERKIPSPHRTRRMRSASGSRAAPNGPAPACRPRSTSTQTPAPRLQRSLARSDLDRRRRGRRHPMRPPSLARATTARLVARVMITGAGSTPPLGAAGPFADTGPSPTSISNDEDWTMNVGTALTKVFIARHSTQSRAGMRYESGLPTAWPSPVLCVAFAL
jgi:hypothetical protein